MHVGHLEERTLDLSNVVLTSHRALPAKLNRQGTGIVNVASTGAFQGFIQKARNKEREIKMARTPLPNIKNVKDVSSDASSASSISSQESFQG